MGAHRFILLAFASFFYVSLFARQPADALPSADRAYEHALAVILHGDKTEVVDKRIGPIRAIATTHDDSSRELVSKVVGEINDAFGYGKLALSWSDSPELEDDAITIYIGPKTDGRQLIKRFGVSSPRAFRSSTYYYWWEDARRNHIRRCLIAVDHLLLKEHQSEDLRYLLLACMGFKSPWSAKQLQRTPNSSDASQGPLFSKFDTAIIRFFDKHVEPGAKAWEMRRVFKNKWPDFSAAYYNPQVEPDSNQPVENGSRLTP